VALHGAAGSVILAVKEVLDITFGSDIRGMNQPYDPINFDGFFANEYGGFGSDMDARGASFPGRGGGGGRGGMGGAFGGPGTNVIKLFLSVTYEFW